MEPLFLDYPKNEICDIVILVKSADLQTHQMTQSAINSLIESEPNNTFRVTLVESEKNNPPKYSRVHRTIQFQGDEFNYNSALNQAFASLDSDCVHIGVFNNDVLFKPNWYSVLRYYMDVFDLDVASPRSPISQIGQSPQTLQFIASYPEHAVVLGAIPIIIFSGWGWIMNKKTLDLLLPLDSDFKFWSQDSMMCFELDKLQKKVGCVTSSYVEHLGQRSYSQIPKEKLYEYTNGMNELFKRKIGA